MPESDNRVDYVLRLLDRLDCPFTLSVHHRPSRDATMNDYWIPINVDQDVQVLLEKAVTACYRAHVFTLDALNNFFIKNTEHLLVRDFKADFALFLSTHRGELRAQQYSLWRASEKTFPYFRENKKINKNGKFFPVKPIDPNDYKEIQIEKREVWQKYLALNSLITTSYGTIFLDEEKWPEIMVMQALDKKVSFDMVPFLWHSVTVRMGSEPKLRFNLHDLDSRFGKKAKKAIKQHE